MFLLLFFILGWLFAIVKTKNRYKISTFILSLGMITFYAIIFKNYIPDYFSNPIVFWTIEEFIKLWVALIVAWFYVKLEKHEPKEQLKFFAKIYFLSALSFAGIENAMYFYNFILLNDIWINTYLNRIFLSSSLHILLPLIFIYNLKSLNMAFLNLLKNIYIKMIVC